MNTAAAVLHAEFRSYLGSGSMGDAFRDISIESPRKRGGSGHMFELAQQLHHCELKTQAHCRMDLMLNRRD